MLQIDAVWIDTIQQFLHLTGTSLESYVEQLPGRQIRREKEIANLSDTTADKTTAFAKQIVVPYLHTIQKNALKHLSAEEKKELLQLSAQIR